VFSFLCCFVEEEKFGYDFTISWCYWKKQKKGGWVVSRGTQATCWDEYAIDCGL
jgi:hypothetical protein